MYYIAVNLVNALNPYYLKRSGDLLVGLLKLSSTTSLHLCVR